MRCQSCGETWRATPDAAPLELSTVQAPGQAPGQTPNAAGESVSGPNGEAVAPFPRADAVDPASLADTPAPELPRAFRARAEQKKRMRSAAVQGIVWAGIIGLFLTAVACLWLFRVELVEKWPRAATAYDLVGVRVNPVGLEFEALAIQGAPNTADQVLVSGAVRNVRDREIVVPSIRLAVLDAQGREVGHQVLRLDAAPVLPGKVQGFAALLPDPRRQVASVRADFVSIAAARSRPAPQASQGDAAHDADAPAPVRRPPPAEEGGLRPAASASVNGLPSPMAHTAADAVPETGPGAASPSAEKAAPQH